MRHLTQIFDNLPKPIWKSLLTFFGCILIALFILFGNLPDSPLQRVLTRHSHYLRMTFGMVQGWGMFSHPPKNIRYARLRFNFSNHDPYYETLISGQARFYPSVKHELYLRLLASDNQQLKEGFLGYQCQRTDLPDVAKEVWLETAFVEINQILYSPQPTDSLTQLAFQPVLAYQCRP